jgi:hypothetical protein
MSSVQIIKLESQQVGAFNVHQNLIDFQLPDYTIDLSRSYVNLISRIDTTDDTSTLPTGVYQTYFGSSNTWDSTLQLPEVYAPKCLVRNSSMACSKGDLGGYRHANVLALNKDLWALDSVLRDEDSYRQGLSYAKTINGTQGGLTPFKTLGAGVPVVNTANLQISLKDLHGLANAPITHIPLGALGGVRMRLELENVVPLVQTYTAYFPTVGAIAACNNQAAVGNFLTILTATTTFDPSWVVGSEISVSYTDATLGALVRRTKILTRVGQVITPTVGTLPATGTSVQTAITVQLVGFPAVACNNQIQAGGYLTQLTATAAIPSQYRVGQFILVSYTNTAGDEVDIESSIMAINGLVITPATNSLVSATNATAISYRTLPQPNGLPCGNIATGDPTDVVYVLPMCGYYDLASFPLWVGERVCVYYEFTDGGATQSISRHLLIESITINTADPPIIAVGFTTSFPDYGHEMDNIQITEDKPLTAVYTISQAQLVLTRPLPTSEDAIMEQKMIKQGLQIIYPGYDLENFNMYSSSLFSQMFWLPPACPQVLILNPSELYGQIRNVNGYRLRLDGIQTTNRDVQTDTSLHYDQLKRGCGAVAFAGDDWPKYMIAQALDPKQTRVQLEVNLVAQAGAEMPQSLLYVYKQTVKMLQLKGASVNLI